MSRRVIIGAGSLGREVFEWGCEGSSTSPPVVFIDDNPEARHKLGREVFPLEWFEVELGDAAILAVADPNMRAHLWARVTAKMPITFFRHRTALGGFGSQNGLLMLPYSLISTNARIGRACILNTHATVGHDVVLGDFCTLSSHVDICGRVEVGDRVFFGSGARVIPDVKIGSDAVIGAGSVVVQDVPAGATVFGNPARRVK